MAQTIKHRRGGIETVASITGFGEGEIVIGSGSVADNKLIGPITYIGKPNGTTSANDYVPISKIYSGAGLPALPSGTYGSTLNGLPYYDTTNSKLYILGSSGTPPYTAGHTEITLTSESIQNFTSDVITLINQNATSVDITELNNFTGSMLQFTSSVTASIIELQQGIAFSTGSGIATSITAGVTASFTSSGAGLSVDLVGTAVTYSIGDATDFLLGDATSGLNEEPADSTVYTAINNIDTILALLAPPKPVNLSAATVSTTEVGYTGQKPDGSDISPVYLNTNALQKYTFTKAASGGSQDGFWDGKTGTLTAQVSSSDNGYQTVGSKVLTTGDDAGTYNTEAVSEGGVYATSKLEITGDIDYWDGVEGKAGFWDALEADVYASFTSSGDSSEPIGFKVKLSHSVTGDKESGVFYVSTPVDTIITNRGASYDETINGVHYQSGIPYIGNANDITASYTVEIPSTTQLINSSGYIGRVDSSYTAASTKSVTTWTAGTTYNVTASLDVDDSKFLNGTALQFTFTEYAFDNTDAGGTVNLASNVMLDSKVEDETNPGGSSERVGSGTGQFPTADIDGTGPSTSFGTIFDSEELLTTSNHAELRFANEYFLWPSATNYTTYTPAGPNYSTVGTSGVDSYNNMRWATFNVGSVSAASNITLTINGAQGFDATTLQTTDGFEMYVKVQGDTEWIDCNAAYAGVGSPGDSSNGDGGVNLGASSSTTKVITFGAITRTGDVYVRIGWQVAGGTNPTLSTDRKFKYIQLS